MPLISGFRSTNIWKAFILNSISSSLVIIIALTVKSKFDTFSNKYKDTNNVKQQTNLKSILLTIIATFISSMIAYSSMYFIFGYGGGMLVNN
tara:strand:- start:596 stop:871 length:276 start_codon:yes stop_codon:yes gene_type:complete